MNLNSIHSIGHASQLIQSLPGRIREAAAALGIQPAAHINGVPHFNEADLEKIATHIRSRQQAGSIDPLSQRSSSLS